MDVQGKRELLRELMADCSACVPEDADDVPEADLDKWIHDHRQPDVATELTDEDRRILREAGVEVP